MTPAAPAFKPGDQVHLRNDRARVGQVEEEPRRRGAVYWYRIRFVEGGSEVVAEPNLDRLGEKVTPEELLARSAFGDRDDFVRLVTFHKLNVPLDNTLYSLFASRTEFYPHQYRPLVKFLDSKSQRLLIADEVGLGKTIEAGLILAELRARRALRHVMVICPKALCLKWKEEMWRRFDEDFEIYSAGDLRRLLELVQEREPADLRVIVPLQSIRREAILEQLEASRLPLDLVIVDEAHHLRNSATISNRAVSAVTEYADGVLLLTATPVQIGNENLFNLLRILDPQEFDDYETFRTRLEANAPVVEAERLIRSSFPPPVEQVQDRLRQLERGYAATFFAKNPLYRRIVAELDREEPLDRSDVARLHQDLKELNLLGHILTRTRKREVFTRAAERTPRTLRPEPTDAELRFYDRVTQFVRSTAQSDSGFIHQFAAIMAQRQVASCMPAARARFTGRAAEQLDVPEEADLADEFWLEDDEQRTERLNLPQLLIEAAESLGDTDTKFDALLDALHTLDREDPGCKILLFSYFRDTLSYLRHHLESAGFGCELITGDVASNPQEPQKDERGARMRRFRDDPVVRVLLSSEVGSEGLDFQFCHVLVNYDLPWNPMLVEQRIGRLDRLGQNADRIIIINFSMRGTIEQRILERLYNRIGIFIRSIGDLEAIMGDDIAKMTRDLLTQQLSPEEEERRIQKAADAIAQRQHQLELLEKEASRFVGSDAFFEEQLERARRGGELLAPDHLHAFLRAFLDAHYPRSKLRATHSRSVFSLEVDPDLDQALRRAAGGSPKFRFLSRLSGGAVRVTFEPEIAFADDGVELLAAHHPVMVVAAQHYRTHPQEIHPVSALRIGGWSGLESGTYAYCLFEVRIEAGRERRRLEVLFVSLATGETVSEAEGSLLLGEVLRTGRRWEHPPQLGPDAARELLRASDDRFLDRLSRYCDDLEIRNTAVAETRIASLTSAHRLRVGKKQALLRNAIEAGRQERYIRMLEGTLRKMEADFRERLADLEAERTVGFRYSLIGCGLLDLEAR
jgi:superfamily II DNA or RNA helicase